MKAYRWNGERWWLDDNPIWRRTLKWICWVGGWSIRRDLGKANWRHHRGRGDSFARSLVEQADLLAPISLFGHRVTFFGWGWQIRMKGGYWVASRSGREDTAVYWSPDGTPYMATVWLKGTPREVVYAHEEAQRENERIRRVKERIA